MYDAIARTVLAEAATAFRVPAAALDPLSRPETVEGWDSAAGLRLAMALEEALGLAFTIDDLERMTSLGAIIALARKRAAKPG